MISEEEREDIEVILDSQKIEADTREYLYTQIEEFDSQYLKLKASGYPKNTRDHTKKINTLIKHILEAQRIGMLPQDIRINPPIAKQDNINRLYARLKESLDDESIKNIIGLLTSYKTIVFYTGSKFEYLTPYAGFINSLDRK